MTNIKRFLTLILFSTLSALTTYSWATEQTASKTIAAVATANSWENATKYTSFSVDSKITASVSGGSNTGKYYSALPGTWRLYANESATLTITASTGCTLKSIIVTFSPADNGTLLNGSTTMTSGTAVTASGTSKSFSVSQSSGSKGKIYVSAISVTYDDGASTKTVKSISVKTAQTKYDYVEGEYFDPAGLVLAVKYTDNSTEDIDYDTHSSAFSFTPSLTTALTEGETEVTVTYGGKSTTTYIWVDAAAPLTEYTASWYVADLTTPVHTQTAVAGTSLTGIPTPDKDDCDGEKAFVGWTTNSSFDGTNASHIAAIITSTTGLKMPSNDISYYAVFATSGEGGDAFDGSSAGTYKIYALVGTTKYYATGTTGNKISSTTTAADAKVYTFEKHADNDGTFNIKDGSSYVKYSSGTNLATDSDPYKWDIISGTHGTWRIRSYATNTRAIIFSAGEVLKFGGYATSNVTTTSDYYDLEIETASSYTDYSITCTSFVLTAQSNNTSYGTVSVSGKKITATPASGYRVSTTTPYTVVVGNSTTKVTQNGNKFSVTSAVDCTIRINFEAVPTFTAKWFVGGTAAGFVARIQTAAEGTTLTSIPTPTSSDCDNQKTFMGWTTTSTFSGTTEEIAALITNTSGLKMPGADINYYAVFASSSDDPIKRLEINADNMTGLTSDFNSTAQTFTVDGIDFKFKYCKKSTNIVIEGYTTYGIYNLDKLGKRVQKIVIEQTGTPVDVSAGGSNYFDEEEAAAAGGTFVEETLTPPATAARMVFDFAGKDFPYVFVGAPEYDDDPHIDSVVIYYEEDVTYTDYAISCAKYIITAESNNTSYGTVALSGNTITATPASGYRISRSTPYEVISGTATVARTDNKFKVAPESDCTIRINFEPIPVCTNPGWTFSDGISVVRSIGSGTYTNAINKHGHESDGATTYTSSEETVATVDNTGAVTILAVGVTTITLNLEESSASEYCEQTLSYTLAVRDPSIEIVGVNASNGIIIEHDLSGAASITITQRESHSEGSVANDLFFSKYFEAASHMKLFAIFNGTDHNIDLSKIRIRSASSAGAWNTSSSNQDYVELKNVPGIARDYENSMLPPMTELIFWSNKDEDATNNNTLRGCISMTINDVDYHFEDMQKGLIPNWYRLGSKTHGIGTGGTGDDYNGELGTKPFLFNGDDPILMERNVSTTSTPNWQPIDLIGAVTDISSYEPLKVTTSPSNSGSGAFDPNDPPSKPFYNFGKILDTDGTTKLEINGFVQDLNDGVGYWAKCDGNKIPYSTNRYMLIRKSTVKDGSNAIKDNVGSFATLCTEWNGTPVGGSTDVDKENNPYCFSGESFSAIAEYDYAKNYVTWDTLPPSVFSETKNPDGTVTITVTDLDERACKTLMIAINKEGSKKPIAETTFDVPIVVKGNIDTDNDIFKNKKDTCKSCDVVILNGGTLTKINDDNKHWGDTARNIEVYAGGKLVVPTGKEYVAGQVTVRMSIDGESNNMLVPKIILDGSIKHNTGGLAQRVRIGTSRFYAFTVPYEVDLTKVTYINGETAAFGTDYMIRYYDGASRASSQEASGNWKNYTGDRLYPGVGYTIAAAKRTGHSYREFILPMATADLSVGEPATKETEVHAWGWNTGARANHIGWNYVANPYLRQYNKDHIDEDASLKITLGQLIPDDENPGWFKNDGGTVPYVTQINASRTDYGQFRVDDTDLPPFTPFFVQIGVEGQSADDAVTMTFHNSNRETASYAPIRRDIIMPSVTHVDFLISGINASDNFGVTIGEQYSPAYEMQADLSKEFGSANSLKAYTLQDEDNLPLAFNAINADRLSQPIPVGIRIPSSGEYTFSINQRYDLAAFEHVYLHDITTGKFVDLLEEPYNFTSDQGKNENRFSLSIVLRPQTPSDVEKVVSGIFISGRKGSMMFTGLPETAEIYIYDMAGRLITSDHVSNVSSATYAVPNGVYQVRVLGDGKNALLRTIVY